MTLSTKTIFLKLQDTPMGTFLANWVMFEEVVVSIYNTGKFEDDDYQLLGSLRFALMDHYLRWADMLQPYWQRVKVAGVSLGQDPFLAILDTSVFSGQSSGSYEAVKGFSAVRKTFNLMLADQLVP